MRQAPARDQPRSEPDGEENGMSYSPQRLELVVEGLAGLGRARADDARG